MSSLALAKSYVASGISAIPIRPDGSKAPAVPSWKPFQERIGTADEINRMFRANCGVAAITGKVSGNLEVADFEVGASFQACLSLVQEQAPELAASLVIVNTPS